LTWNFYFRLFVSSALLLLTLAPISDAASRAADSDRIHWSQLDDAQLKIDSNPPLSWGVFQPDKKSKKKGTDLLLVLIGRRFMMLDLNAKVVYLVFPQQLTASGKDFESGDLANSANVIPTTNWSIRDVGPAELIRLTLGDYGRLLDVSLYHPPNLANFY